MLPSPALSQFAPSQIPRKLPLSPSARKFISYLPLPNPTKSYWIYPVLHANPAGWTNLRNQKLPRHFHFKGQYIGFRFIVLRGFCPMIDITNKYHTQLNRGAYPCYSPTKSPGLPCPVYPAATERTTEAIITTSISECVTSSFSTSRNLLSSQRLAHS
ncbi:hypothetical protein JAAARDRAFT_528754 [Jaapia argillacea MUCL 33604]|uniref:Uncharacterized protein n=1 Tax=Jaapia argillacea MUCL 33604 TaxID=933084 RepID=A0A067Q4K9_9AGAM|nr:hypothetical protein JAAARDRAFT_528754 [Jaapia argillacea MUCL 33604]